MSLDFPIGFDAIIKEYGDPRLYLRGDGTIHHSWEAIALSSFMLPAALPLGWDESVRVSKVRCHRKVALSLRVVFEEIFAKGLWGQLKTFDGSYAWRVQRGSAKKLSTHCWGIGIDLNAETNQLGTDGDMPPEIVQVFQKHGWTWGGEWARKDMMHFQACSGY
jgi:hypothetical protein